MKTVLILGAGFAGLELATRLSEDVPDEVEVTIIDSSDAFVFGFSKLDVMFGRDDPANVRLPYSRLDKPSVRFVQDRIVSIDAQHRRVTTDTAQYDPDILVLNAINMSIRCIQHLFVRQFVARSHSETMTSVKSFRRPFPVAYRMHNRKGSPSITNPKSGGSHDGCTKHSKVDRHRNPGGRNRSGLCLL